MVRVGFFLATFSAIFLAAHAACPFIMQSGDVTYTTAIIQASLMSTKCRKPPYTSLSTTVHVEVSKASSFANKILNATLSAVEFAGYDARQYAGAYVAKVHLSNLEPNTYYYYRFTAETGEVSPVGRVKTLYRKTMKTNFRLVHMSCANKNPYPVSGALAAHVVARKPDLNIFNGDVVYADRFWLPSNLTEFNKTSSERCCRNPVSKLSYYRSLYADQRDSLYTGAGFPTVLRTVPTVSTWDDHAVNNNYAGQDGAPRRIIEQLPSKESPIPELQPRHEVEAQQKFAYQAFFEMNAITPGKQLQEEDPAPGLRTRETRLFRRFTIGTGAEIFVLDLRQYRDVAPQTTTLLPVLPKNVSALELCDPKLNNPLIAGACTELPQPIVEDEDIRTTERTMLGKSQKTWLKKSLKESTAQFKLIVSSVQMFEWYVSPNDRWEGYWLERVEILNFIEEENIKNVVFLAGDMHASIYAQLNPGRSPAIYEVSTGPIGSATFGSAVGQLRMSLILMIEKYGSNGHLLPEGSEKPVKFANIDESNFMTVEYDGSRKMTFETIGADGKVVVDKLGNVGRLVLEAGCSGR